MKVSVIVPVFNKQAFLLEAIESALQCRSLELEVIAVDDKSTDGSLDLLRSIPDSRMRVVALESNLGPAGAAQHAMDLAVGEYMVRLDADDIMLPGRIERQVAFMDARPELVASGGHVRLFGDSDTLWRLPLTDAECRARMLFGVPIAQPACIMRTALLRAHGVRYENDWPRYGEDWLFFARASRAGGFANLDESVIMYRRGEQNSHVGRDRTGDYERLFPMLFKEFGLPLSEAELEMHLCTIRIFKRTPTAPTVGQLRSWLNSLLMQNQEHSLFPAPAFTAQVESIWSNLFYFIADRDPLAALEHMRISKQWPVDRLYYLASARMRGAKSMRNAAKEHS